MVRFGSLVMCLAATLHTVDAHAQLRWDVGARVGAGKRALGSQPEGTSDGQAGPVGEVSLHAALIPLVRIGPTFSAEVSPVAGKPTRRHCGVGVEARVFAPLPYPKIRPFLYVGVRGVLVRQAETEVSSAATGGYVSVPFGVGASVLVHKRLRMVATFGGDGAFARGGTVYDPTQVRYAGNDVAGVRGMVGVDLEF